MNKSFFLLTILLFVQFGTFSNILIPEPDATVHDVMDKTIDILAKKYNLNPCGIGMNGKFEYLEISFQIRKNLNRDEIRTMLMDCGEEFLKNVNSCEKIKPYLKPNPFTIKNTGIVLFIRDENNNDVIHPEICDAALDNGEISYHTQSKENRFRYKETYEESYEEASALLEKNKDSSEIAETKNPE
ncbi:MAG: hypothetical protein K1000chlam3_01713 [Chlamydiae bacterium]|nr:hypothetical protein [Chlamydiota bacterium]